MQAKKILFATDFSPSSEDALEMAASLARDTGATLVIVHVEVIPYTVSGGEYMYTLPVANTSELQEQLNKVVPKDRSIAVEHRLITGDPADAVIQMAEAENIDLIVIGTHGRRGLTRLLMGSVAEAIVRAAPCPVLTVKQSSKKSVAATE